MKKISNDFSISGPMDDTIIKTLKAQGVTKMINVRPDNEEPEQESSEQLAIKIRTHGIEYAYIPVKTNYYSDQDITEFSKQIATSNEKVHAFCRTGNRAIHLWALAKSHSETVQYIKRLCKKSDCNISSIEEQMRRYNALRSE